MHDTVQQYMAVGTHKRADKRSQPADMPVGIPNTLQKHLPNRFPEYRGEQANYSCACDGMRWAMKNRL